MTDEHLHIHVHVHTGENGRVNHLLREVLTQLQANHAQGFNIMAELDTLTTQVKANTDAEASAVLLINGFSARLDAAIAAGNPQALTDLSAELKTSADTLAAAVVANTPAATA